jgi:hypothetical protein
MWTWSRNGLFPVLDNIYASIFGTPWDVQRTVPNGLVKREDIQHIGCTLASRSVVTVHCFEARNHCSSNYLLLLVLFGSLIFLDGSGS